MAVLNKLVLAVALGGAFAAAVSQAASGAEMVAVKAQPTAAQRLAALAVRYYDEMARFEPLNATFSGDNRFDDQLPMTIDAGVRARQYALLHDVRDQLMRIDRSKLSAQDMTSFDMLAFTVNEALRFEPFKDHLLPMNQMDSLPVMLANLGGGEGSQPLTSVAQYQAYHKRIAALPQWIDTAIANMREGMQENIVLPRALVLPMLAQIKALAGATPAASDFNAARRLPDTFDAGEKAGLKGVFLNTVSGQVLPSLRKLARFLEHDYLPAARSSAGWGALPGGAQWYGAYVAAHTTTTLGPDEIHRIGVAEVARITAELARLAPKVGYTGAPGALPRWMASQPRYRPFKTDEQVLQAYRDLRARIEPKLGQLFATLPKAPLEIRPEPALSRESASDHYTMAAMDGARPGIFWAVIPDPAQYGSTKMTALFLHESLPGHHFQLSKQQELAVPTFRKVASINAYAEGWGLYAETLGREMGLYDEPNAYAGFLSMELRRAARLVVDTGLHAKGWTREQTIRYLVDEAGDTEDDARNATERYMAWPGQALGYKIGALKIMELRQRAAAKLGAKFSLAKFHDAVLAEGSLPLDLLETKIDAWIATQGGAK
ncbi:DUF885 domain-containing protein [Massilia sp. TWP1-3-3]|uniref:DUF885 domain-containing protein n=1 Tax=Massilia sp. TWP1-3-3 TaxID=2804573 RepID=UPI003CF15CAA